MCWNLVPPFFGFPIMDHVSRTRRGWIWMVGLLAILHVFLGTFVSLGLPQWDLALSRWIQSGQSPFWDSCSRLLSQLGNGANPFLLVALIGVVLFLRGWTRELQLREQPWNGGAQLDAGAWPEDRAWTLDGSDQTGESGFALELSSRDTKLSSRGEIVEEGRSQIFHSGVSTWANLEPARERPSTAAQHKSLGVAPAELTTAVWFPVARRPGLNTGLAIRRTTAPVRYSLFDSSGLLLETVTRDDFQGAQFFNEIFSEVPASFTGSVKVESDRGFYLTVLRQEILPGEGLSFQLTSIPATPVPIELIGSGSD